MDFIYPHKKKGINLRKFKIGSFVSLVTGLALYTGITANVDDFKNVGSLYDKAVSKKITDLIFIQK